MAPAPIYDQVPRAVFLHAAAQLPLLVDEDVQPFAGREHHRDQLMTTALKLRQRNLAQPTP